MLKKLKALIARGPAMPSTAPTGGAAKASAIAPTVAPTVAPTILTADDGSTFPFADHIEQSRGMCYVDWSSVDAWIESLPSDQIRMGAWTACARAWLEHMRAELGQPYRVIEDDESILLSTLPDNLALATLDFMSRTPKRIRHLLQGVAAGAPQQARQILIVFDDYDAYYNYVAHYYPEEGEFAGSGGMYIGTGCAHFVTVKEDLRSLEPVIVHEMTHGCVAHLPIPAWLNEGIAVNMEGRLSNPAPGLYTPLEMHDKHLAFWGVVELQEFWSGTSFLRPDEGNSLSYDLARIMVTHLAMDWQAFLEFVRHADRSDAGAASARDHLGVDLGHFACALLEKSDSTGFSPDPQSWKSEPLAGAFTTRCS